MASSEGYAIEPLYWSFNLIQDNDFIPASASTLGKEREVTKASTSGKSRKVHECKECDFQTIKLYNLQRRMKMHTKQKPLPYAPMKDVRKDATVLESLSYTTPGPMFNH